MRPTITAARPPFSRELYDLLREHHARFDEVFHRLLPAPNPERLARQARQLSEIYNHLAPQNPYGRPELADARLHFFMPTDIAKVWGPLVELLPALDPASLKRLSILDLGGGTGTGTVAASMALAAAGFRGQAESVIVEPDAAVNRHLRTTFDALQGTRSVNLGWRLEQATIEGFLNTAPEQRFDLVLVVNVLSEAFTDDAYAAGAANLIRRLLAERVKKSGFLVLIEPALKRFSRLLYAAGDACRQEGLPLFAPCLAPACPHLAKANGFCFHSMRVPMTPLLQSVAARSGLERHEVNHAYLTFGRGRQSIQAPVPGEGEILGRIVSFPRRIKKGFNYHVCTANGLLVAFAPRTLPDGETRGNRLPHGTLVTIASHS
jgi:hypothetical protein